MALRIAMVGDAASVGGFKPVGLAVFPVSEPADARELWDDLSGGEYAVVLVTEPVFEAIADLVAEGTDRPIPAVTVIPGAGSAGGVGQAKLDAAIERALGTTAFVPDA